MVKVKVNLNDYVWVQLRPKGYQELRDYYNRQTKACNLTVEELYGCNVDELVQRIVTKEPDWRNKPIRIQLWRLIQFFGPVMKFDFNDLFYNTLEIEVNE